MISTVESAAQMTIGQAVLKVVDKMLWIVEKSVQWSLPTPEVTAEENGKSFGKIELVRPLPWILFLPTLLVLRIVRISINVTARVLGYPTVEPADMIRVIQRGRRRIRAVKSSGMKSMRQKKTPPLTEEKIDSTTVNPVPADSKRKYSEVSSDDSSEEESDEEPLVAKINRLANDYDSDKDKDYTPCESSSESDTSASSSELEADLSISMSEVKDLEEAQKELEKAWTIDVEKVEEEKVKSDNEKNVKTTINQIDKTSL